MGKSLSYRSISLDRRADSIKCFFMSGKTHLKKHTYSSSCLHMKFHLQSHGFEHFSQLIMLFGNTVDLCGHSPHLADIWLQNLRHLGLGVRTTLLPVEIFCFLVGLENFGRLLHFSCKVDKNCHCCHEQCYILSLCQLVKTMILSSCFYHIFQLRKNKSNQYNAHIQLRMKPQLTQLLVNQVS